MQIKMIAASRIATKFLDLKPLELPSCTETLPPTTEYVFPCRYSSVCFGFVYKLVRLLLNEIKSIHLKKDDEMEDDDKALNENRRTKLLAELLAQDRIRQSNISSQYFTISAFLIAYFLWTTNFGCP